MSQKNVELPHDFLKAVFLVMCDMLYFVVFLSPVLSLLRKRQVFIDLMLMEFVYDPVQWTRIRGFDIITCYMSIASSVKSDKRENQFPFFSFFNACVRKVRVKSRERITEVLIQTETSRERITEVLIQRHPKNGGINPDTWMYLD